MPELLQLDETLWIWTKSIGVGIYDFDFRRYFPCRQPWQRPTEVTAIGRCGAFGDYAGQYQELLSKGIRLVHTPAQHHLASELSEWYPLLEDLTPPSKVYQETPSGEEVAGDFAFPVFVKGTRQTSRHQKSLSVANSPAEFDQLMQRYAQDSILHWQSVVVRQLVPLRLVERGGPDQLDRSFEFRTLWWNSKLVGAGRYWWEDKRYDWSAQEQCEGLRIAETAAARVSVPFLVIDVAITAAGEWIVIECNDGQESGYAGISPIALWQNILDCERSTPSTQL